MKRSKFDSILICRVSDPRQLDGYSIDAQIKHGGEYSLQREFKILKEFVFQETGSKAKERKIFANIMSFIVQEASLRSRNEPLNIVVEKSDRFGREHGPKEIITNLVLAGLVVIHYYKEGRVLDHTCTPTDIFLDDIMTSVSRYTALNIGREAKKGMVQKCESGWFPGKAPWGYKNIQFNESGKLRGIIVPDPDSRHFVAHLFFLRAEYGLSYNAIFERVKSEGMLPSVRKKNGKIKVFYVSNIEKILKNQFYGGTFQHGSDKVYLGRHELIVAPEIYKKVHASFAGKVSGTRHNQNNLFGGWMVCGKVGCGCKIGYHFHKKKSGLTYGHYICANGRNVHASLKGLYVTEDDVFKQFEPVLDSIAITDVMAKDIHLALQAGHRQTLARKRREAESFDQSLRELERREDELYKDLKALVLDEVSYQRHLKKLREERQTLMSQLHQSQEVELDKYLQRANIVLELAQHAKTLWKSRTAIEKRDFLKLLVWNPRLNPPTVEYEMKKPFKLLAQMVSNKNWGD